MSCDYLVIFGVVAIAIILLFSLN